MRDLRPVVQVPALPVLDAGQDFPFRSSMTLQLVGHDHTRHIPQAFQQLPEEALGRLGAAPALHQDVEHGAVLVDRRPEVVELGSVRSRATALADEGWLLPRTVAVLGILEAA